MNRARPLVVPLPLLTAAVGFRDSAAATPAPAAGPQAAASGAVPAEVAARVGLPAWHPPESYHVDMVMTSEGKTVTIKRFLAGPKIRSEIQAEGQKMVMIEAGNEPGTTFMVMPEQKRALKQSRAAMTAAVEEAPRGEAAHEPAGKVEALGVEKLDGRDAKKYRITSGAGSVLAWFDAGDGAPLRMETLAEGHPGTIEWRDYRPGPQPAALFEVPKGYEVTDLDEMMAQMKGAGGLSGLTGMKGMGRAGAGAMGMPGTGAGGMAQGLGQQMGADFGAGLGSTLGASFGGPLGAVAGQYIGGKIGGMVGRKAADVVTPGK